MQATATKPLVSILFASFIGSNVVKGFMVESPTRVSEKLPNEVRTIPWYSPESPNIKSTLVKQVAMEGYGGVLAEYKTNMEKDPTAYPFVVETLKKSLAMEEIENIVWVDWASQIQLDKSGSIQPYEKTEEDEKLVEGLMEAIKNPLVVTKEPKKVYPQANPDKTFVLTDFQTSKGFTFEIAVLHKDTKISTHIFIPCVTKQDDFESVVQFFETEALLLFPNTIIKASFSNFETFGKEDVMGALSLIHAHPDQKSIEYESRRYKTPITEIQVIDWSTQLYSIVDENGMGPVLTYMPTEENKELVGILKKITGQ